MKEEIREALEELTLQIHGLNWRLSRLEYTSQPMQRERSSWPRMETKDDIERTNDD